MEKINILEKELENKIKKLILGEEKNHKEISLKLKEFFRLKEQADIDKINPRNIRLFTLALEILQKNKKLSPINFANLDYIYSYKNKPLKYSWKSCEFNFAKDFIKIKEILNKIVKILNLSKKKINKINNFIEQVNEMCQQKYSSDVESMCLLNDARNSFVYLEYRTFYDNYNNKKVCEFNILLVSPSKILLKTLPNNDGMIYSNLIFREN